MSEPRTVFCQKLQQELPALERPPIPGERGKRILEHISAQAWGMFEAHFRMICNEYRLNLMDPATDQVFFDEMERYLFQGTARPPEGFVPPAGS